MTEHGSKLILYKGYTFHKQSVTVILLPLRHVFLMHKKCQRPKIIHGMHVGRKNRSMDRSENVLIVEHPVRVISVAVLAAVV